jgi:hypothetical protein
MSKKRTALVCFSSLIVVLKFLAAPVRAEVKLQDLSCKSLGNAPIYASYINGIRTDHEKFERDLLLVEGFFRESNINLSGFMGSHNPTGWTGGVGDVYESIRQNFLIQRTTDRAVTDRVIKWIMDVDRMMAARCPGASKIKFVLVGHSQGTFFIEDVAEKLQNLNLPNDLSSRVSIFAISPFTAFKKVRMRKHYVLRKDDFPKAHAISGIGPAGVLKPNLDGLVIVNGYQKVQQTLQQQALMDICGVMKISGKTVQSTSQLLAGKSQTSQQTMSYNLNLKAPTDQATDVFVDRFGVVTVTTSKFMPCQDEMHQAYMAASLDQQGASFSSKQISNGAMFMQQYGDLHIQNLSTIPDKSPTVFQTSHRLDYYIGSQTNHTKGWQDYHAYSADIARTKSAAYVMQLLMYDSGVYP